MDPPVIKMHDNQRSLLNRFKSACQKDERIVAAFLGGSHAEGTADANSDLDLFLIATDAAYEELIGEREALVRQLGEPLFLEDFGIPHGIFYIFSDDTEGELWIERESKFNSFYFGHHRVLLDKKGVLLDAVFARQEADLTQQIQVLRQQIYWFWHELSHFITAMGRGQLWWAYGQLESMRDICINLSRLKHNFLRAEIGEEPYFKVEQALSAEQLSPLRATYCPMEMHAMRHAVLVILSFYKEKAKLLAATHDVAYPDDLERLMLDRLRQLGGKAYGDE